MESQDFDQPDIDTIASDAIFVWDGFIRKRDNDKTLLSDAESDYFNGWTGAAARCVEIARQVDAGLRACLRRWPDLNYPGVYQYDILEEVGAHVRETNGAVGDQFTDWMALQASEWFIAPFAGNNDLNTTEFIETWTGGMRAEKARGGA